jgi:hypothetical protein
MADETKRTDEVVGDNRTPVAEEQQPVKEGDFLAGVPQDQLDAWRFIYENWESDIFNPYADQYIAVHQRKILGSDTHPWRLLHRVATENGIEPDRIAIKFVD